MKAVIGVIFLVVSVETSAYCQPEASVSDKLVEHRHIIRNATLADVLVKLVKDAQVSAGIMLEFENGRTTAVPDMEIAAGTRLNDALSYIVVASGDRYSWSEDRGVLNIMPRNGIQKLLESRLASYQWNVLEKPGLSIGRLLTLSEVQQQVRKYGMEFGLETGFGLEKPPRLNGLAAGLEKDYRIADVSLREALNAVVRSYPVPTVWVYRQARVNDHTEITLGDR